MGLPLKHPSLLDKSNIITKNLCHAVSKATTSLLTRSPKGQKKVNLLCIETAMQILHSFANRVEGDISDHHFWKPLCSLLLQKDKLKPFIHCLQTQALLHDLHLHLSLDEHMCPVCQQVPLTDYLGQFSVEIGVSSKLDSKSPSFLIFLHESSKAFQSFEHLVAMVELDPSNVHIIDSLNGIMTENGLALQFYLPLSFLKSYNITTVSFTTSTIYPDGRSINIPSIVTTCTLVSAFNFPSITHTFQVVKPSLTSLTYKTSFGTLKFHTGDGDFCETVIMISEEAIVSLKSEPLVTKQVSLSEIEVATGPHRYVLHYPYLVDYNRVSFRVSKAQKTITILAPRMKHIFECEKLLFTVNPSDELTMLHMPISDQIMMRLCGKQLTESDRDIRARCKREHALMPPMMESFTILFQCQIERHFHICSPSGNHINALIIIESRLFDLEHKTPVLHIAFCFLEPSFQFTVLQQCVNFEPVAIRKIRVDEAELKLMKEALSYFAGRTVSCNLANTECLQRLEQYKISHYFSQAVIYPLYTCSDPDSYVNLLLSDPSKAAEELKKLNSFSWRAEEIQCHCCGTNVQGLKKCAGCGNAVYCSKECQRKHWKIHKNECKNSLPKSPAKADGNITETSNGIPNVSNDEIVACHHGQLHSNLVINSSETGVSSCDFCGMKSTTLKKCGACKKVQYCNQECQKKDWKKHKQVCIRSKLDSSPVSEGSILRFTSTTTRCSGCEKENMCLRRCLCHKVAYCSTSCQRMDWTRHKTECSHTGH